MEILSNLLFIFGVNICLKSSVKHSKCKQIMLKVLQIFWDIETIYFSIGVICYSLTLVNQKLYVVHVFDIILFTVLRFVFHYKIKRIASCFEKLELHGIFSDAHNNKCLYLFITICFSAQAVFNVISITRSFLSKKIMELYKNLFTFYLLDTPNVSPLFDMSLKFNIFCAVTHYNVFPCVILATCCLSFIGMTKVIRNFNLKLERSLFNNKTSICFQHIIDNLTKMTKILKELNQELSLITLLLFGFWTTSVFYSVSKLIIWPDYQDAFSASISVVEIISYAFQFAAMVITGTSIEDEIFEAKHLVLTVSKGEVYDSLLRKSNDIQLLLSGLDNTRQQATISAWGMFQIKKNLFLVMLGVIVTYEVLIINFIGRE